MALTEGHRKGPGGGPPGRTSPAAATGGGPQPPAAGPRAGTAAAAARPPSRSARGPASAARPCPAGCGRAGHAAPRALRWPVGQGRAARQGALAGPPGRARPASLPPPSPRVFRFPSRLSHFSAQPALFLAMLLGGFPATWPGTGGPALASSPFSSEDVIRVLGVVNAIQAQDGKCGQFRKYKEDNIPLRITPADPAGSSSPALRAHSAVFTCPHARFVLPGYSLISRT